MRLCAVIPSRNHWQAMPGLVAALQGQGIPVLVIDDGSDAQPARALAALADGEAVTVERLVPNRGKGAAMRHGFRQALKRGFTHALQLDADGQHDVSALPALRAAAEAQPHALVTGIPIYDETIPRGRAIGRWITHVWVWVETLSLHVRDSMCGFRIYPLATVAELLDSGETVGDRMDFDTEILVRMAWRGAPVLQLPVRVTYPPGNTSNFRMWADNVRISAMHTRLVFGMLARLPTVLRRRRTIAGRAVGEAPSHWASLAERGLFAGLCLTLAAYRILGRRGCMVLAAPAALYFLATGRTQRRASAAFLGRALGRPARVAELCRHFLGFAARSIDTVQAWAGALTPDRIKVETPAALHGLVHDPRGAIIIVAHHGNVEVARAVLDPEVRARLVILVHTVHARNFTRVLDRVNPAAAVNRLEVSEITPDTAIVLRQLVDAGHWIVIAGDRVPLSGQQRATRVPFLGLDAAFPDGPYILASLLECPVHLMFCRRDGVGFALAIEPFSERIDLPRGQRRAAIAGWAGRYAARLEMQAQAAPFQWFNFYDFWARRPDTSKNERAQPG